MTLEERILKYQVEGLFTYPEDTVAYAEAVQKLREMWLVDSKMKAKLEYRNSAGAWWRLYPEPLRRLTLLEVAWKEVLSWLDF